MVNVIDIRQLNLEELLGVVSLYPWFGAARKELGRRMAGMGAWTPEQFAEASLYVSSRRKMYRLMTASKDVNLMDKDAKELLNSMLNSSADSTTPMKEEKPAIKVRPKIMVVGGDYFSQNQYNEVRQKEDNVFSSFASRDSGYVENRNSEEFDFFTETLAQIYLEQDYIDEAKKIYFKLIERYPEKTDHFMEIVDKIDSLKK